MYADSWGFLYLDLTRSPHLNGEFVYFGTRGEGGGGIVAGEGVVEGEGGTVRGEGGEGIVAGAGVVEGEGGTETDIADGGGVVTVDDGVVNICATVAHAKTVENVEVCRKKDRRLSIRLIPPRIRAR